jgi:hypothetical protein
MSDRCSSALAVPFLGVLASLQLIDPVVANTALVKASQSLEMHGATLALAASISTAFNFAWAVVQLQTSNFWQLVQRYTARGRWPWRSSPCSSLQEWGLCWRAE